MTNERVRDDLPRIDETPERPAPTATRDSPLTADEAAAVIREATRLQQRGATAELSREDVIAMGKELGLSPEAVEQALAKRHEQAAAAEFVKSERRGFYEHATWYVAIIAGLAGIDFLTGGGWWVQWPAMGWGIGLFFHGVAFLQTKLSPQDAQTRAARQATRDQRREERRGQR